MCVPSPGIELATFGVTIRGLCAKRHRAVTSRDPSNSGYIYIVYSLFMLFDVCFISLVYI